MYEVIVLYCLVIEFCLNVNIARMPDKILFVSKDLTHSAKNLMGKS